MDCFHCGLPVPAERRHRVAILGAERELCCAGCEAVARTIVGAGLESYYETRTSCALPPSLPEEKNASEGRHLAEGAGAEAALILDRVRCSACLWLIEQTLRRVPGVLRADVNYATRRAHVAWDAAQTGLAAILDAVRAVGYDAYPYDAARQEALERRERRTALWRLFVAAFGAMQVMMYAFPAYVDGGGGTLSADAEQLMRWTSLLLTLPVIVFSCRPFFDGALQELRGRRIGLDTPIALGIGGGFLASAWATIAGGGEVYFDSVSMLVFLLLAARYAEGAARRRATRALDPLLRVENSRTLAENDVVRVAAGERFPADGVVVEGRSSADESLLTGESRPLPKRAGDEVVAGSINLEQPLAMRVTRAGAETRAAGIARLVERAVASRPRLVEAAERAARALTYVVILTALAALLWKGDVWVAVAILVVTCPCALALAAPIVLTRAGTALLGHGILLTRSRALETLTRATDVVVDKTGTLTTGRLAVSRATLLGFESEARCRSIAAALEATSRHPIANAFPGGDAALVQAPRNEPGQGVEGRIDGHLYRIGTEGYCRSLSDKALPVTGDGQATRIFLADKDGWLAAFDLEDELRPEAAAVIRHIEAEGLQIHLASGDAPSVAAAVARRLGIERYRGAMSPQDKLDYVARLQNAGRVVVMIGDGLNDAPVLAGADASFAMGSGADAAQLKADVVLVNNSLANVPRTLALARRALRLV
ncbi:MAG TPA: heavy metal translocating P-type ATPase, partial [Myxococcota bacterium]|nr:heavy metal translocating P-type ATPase [Myxococcota bacterium]